MATTTIGDRRCPLRATDPQHVCANRDGAEREATGLPALRPGSDCFLGARADLLREVNEINAQSAALALLEAADPRTDEARAFAAAAAAAGWTPRARVA